MDKKLLEDQIVYVDLDGVLVDFDNGFKTISNGIDKKIYIKKYGIDALWKLINEHGEAWWTNLNWMPDGQQLWSFIKTNHVKVLTSGSVRNTGTLALNGKREWVRNHLGDVETIVVNSSTNKQIYSKQGHILIDDLFENIIQWKSKGGIGMLHRNTMQTIKELQEIGNIYK